jgi:type VI secretion system protein ImpH
MEQAAIQDSTDAFERLLAAAPRYEFVQLVRLLERKLALASEVNFESGTRRGLVGTSSLPSDEPLRFAVPSTLEFGASQVQSLRLKNGDSSQLELSVNFMGLIGPAGVLPRHYTAAAIVQARQKENALGDFLNIFHSRLLGLFYRAFARYNPATALETRHRQPDLLTSMLRSLTGMDGAIGSAGFSGATVHEHDVLGFAGLYAHDRRDAGALEQMLAAQLRVPVKIEQFAGQWLEIPPEQQSRLPENQGTSGMHHRLGSDVVLGQRIWRVSSRICVRLGPLDFDRYVDFVTAGAGLRRAGTLARLYVGLEFDLLVRPVLRKEAVPLWQLNTDTKPSSRQLLGRTVWLRSSAKPFVSDFDAAAYAPPNEFSDPAHKTN